MTAQTASPAAVRPRSVRSTTPERTTSKQQVTPEQLPSLPWRRSDLRQLVTLASVGAIVMLLGWEGVSETDDYNTQLIWIVVGASGLIVAALGAGLWLSAGFRNVRERMLAVPDETAAYLAMLDGAPAPERDRASVAGLVTAPGMTRWHHADCLLVQGKRGLRTVDPAREPELRACDVCNP